MTFKWKHRDTTYLQMVRPKWYSLTYLVISMFITIFLSATKQLINLCNHLQTITRAQYSFSYLKKHENATFLLDGKMKVKTSPWKVVCNAVFCRLDFYLKLGIKYGFSRLCNSKFLSEGYWIFQVNGLGKLLQDDKIYIKIRYFHPADFNLRKLINSTKM